MDYYGLSWTIIEGGGSWLAWMTGMEDEISIIDFECIRTLSFECIRGVSNTYSLAAWFTYMINSLKSSLLFLLLECSLNWTWSARYANIFIQNFILYLVSNISCRRESSYFARSFGQQIEFRMIFIILQYDRFWSCFSFLLADTIYYSATSFSFSVSTFLASFGVLPKLKLKRKMSTKSWSPL